MVAAVLIYQEDILKEAFERLDVDSTGFISRDNLRAVLGKTYDNALIDKMLEVNDACCGGICSTYTCPYRSSS